MPAILDWGTGMLNWAAIGATGEVLGAIAVFVTLAYIALQVRSTNKLLLLQYRESNRAAQFDINQREVQDREFSELILRAETDPSSLDEVDRRRVTKHIHDELLHRHAMYLRGAYMNDERVQRVGINGTAELVSKFSFAKEMVENAHRRGGDAGWDSQFIAGVIDRVREVDASA
jgi:hypothetical protein